MTDQSNAFATLRAALEETDQLARAGEIVGYESAYRILRRAVAEVLEAPAGPRTYKPGEKVPASGIYATDHIRQPGKRYVAGGRQATLTRGERFPPSPFPWSLVQEARHVS